MGHCAFDRPVDISRSDVEVVGVKRLLAEELIPVSLFHDLSEHKVHAFALLCQLPLPIFFLDIVITDSHDVEWVPRSMPEDFLNEDEPWFALPRMG